MNRSSNLIITDSSRDGIAANAAGDVGYPIDGAFGSLSSNGHKRLLLGRGDDKPPSEFLCIAEFTSLLASETSAANSFSFFCGVNL